jgi:hypothetical protein
MDKLHTEGVQKVYSSPNIIRVIKSRTLRWTKNVARKVDMMKACKHFHGKSEGITQLRGPKVNDNVVLKRM